MKRIFVSILLLMLLSAGAWAQPTPSTPPSAESLGLQTPQPSEGAGAPPASESGQALVATSEASAKSAAPMAMAVAPDTKMVVPPGFSTPNLFYIPYSPSTTAGCNLGQWLPMWLDVRGSGPLYSYEWYPNGRLVSQQLAYVSYPGWQKMWFYGDAPGWHTLQYYCNGWSNYVYAYVYGGGPGPVPPTPSCQARIVVSSPYMTGFSVYVDGAYVGGDGRGGDPLDGYYSFNVAGNQAHTIKVVYSGGTYTQTKTYYCGNTYTLTIGSPSTPSPSPPIATQPLPPIATQPLPPVAIQPLPGDQPIATPY